MDKAFCPRCKIKKDAIKDFNWTEKSGRSGYCTTCVREYSRNYYKKQKRREKAYRFE